jgi:hypothetical protein
MGLKDGKDYEFASLYTPGYCAVHTVRYLPPSYDPHDEIQSLEIVPITCRLLVHQST